MSDEDLFRASMGGVKPIEAVERVSSKQARRPTPGMLHRRKTAAEEVPVETEGLSGDYVDLVDPLDILSFQRPGVQHGVFRNLRLGKYQVEARLDLHGASIEKARSLLQQFVKDCIANDVRCALITHGKGEQRQPQQALLKSCVAHWLPQLKQVLAFHSAQKHHGGVGASYIMLRKSDKKRLENLEKHQHRR